MTRQTFSNAWMALVVLTAIGGNPTIPQATAGEGKTIKLTEKQFNEVIAANEGDTIELWISSSMPYGWVLTEEHPVLKREKLDPKELEEIRKQEKGPNGVPVAGKAGHFAGRFKVHAKEETTTVVKWTYCKFGDLASTEKELKSGKLPKASEFRPDMKTEEFRPGMVYQVTLKTNPR